MKTCYRILIASCLAAGSMLQAQVSFTDLPADLQMIPRDTDSSGSFTIAGRNSNTAYQHMHTQLVEVATQTVVDDQVIKLAADGSFSFPQRVPARLAEYELRIYLKQLNTEFFLKKVQRLVAGDFFMICGQSNAQASAEVTRGGTEEFLKYSRPWIRGIGTHDDPFAPNYPCAVQSLEFYQSNCNWNSRGFVGTWGLKLQQELSEQTGIPNCFINGSRAGSSLSQNQDSHTPSDTTRMDTCSIYDRLYKKVSHYKLNAAIKAIFWYQGESDAASAATTCSYLNGFDSLYTSWKKDYPRLEKIILLQLNTGCNEVNLAQMREMQRRIGYKYKDICTVPTFGSDTSDRTADQCHYTVSGYNKIAANLLPIVKKFIYKHQVNDIAVFPPALLKAYRLEPYRLCLEFDRNILAQQSKVYASPNKGVAYLKDYFYGENFAKLSILGIETAGNKLYLNLAQGSTFPKKVTYLPHTYTYLPTLYTGPWLLNAANLNMAVPSFFDYPVSDRSDNGWSKTWTNFGNGNIGSYTLKDSSFFYAGDFINNSAEELLCLSYNDATQSGSSCLLNYENGQWKNDSAHVIKHQLIFRHRRNLLIGDFDGDGKDDLLVNGDTVALFKLVTEGWQKIWSDKGSLTHRMHTYREGLYVGDFNGDGRDELLGYETDLSGGLVEFRYSGSDFIAGDAITGAATALLNCREKLLPADYNGDGATDLFGMTKEGVQLLFSKNNKEWKQQPVNNVLGLSKDSAALYEKIMVCNMDEDARQEVVVLKESSDSSTISFLSLKQLTPWVSSWTANHDISSNQFINDWPVDASLDGGSSYLFIRVKIGEPEHLLALRRENCGYLANLYRYTGDTTVSGSTHPDGNGINDSEFFIHPNPTSDLVDIRLPERYANTISVFDLQGRMLMQLSGQVHTTRLDLGALEKGMYLIKVSNTQHTSAKKLLVEK